MSQLLPKLMVKGKIAVNTAKPKGLVIVVCCYLRIGQGAYVTPPGLIPSLYMGHLRVRDGTLFAGLT